MKFRGRSYLLTDQASDCISWWFSLLFFLWLCPYGDFPLNCKKFFSRKAFQFTQQEREGNNYHVI